MLMLQIYKKSSDQLGLDEIGMKILPGIIPMLVGNNLNKTQFKEIMSCAKKFLQQIEDTKLASLPDTEIEEPEESKQPVQASGGFGLDDLDFMGTQNPQPS